MKAEREPLLAVCDRALYRTVKLMRPRYVVGVGKFTAGRAAVALQGLDVVIGGITHPSPANPLILERIRAGPRWWNRSWLNSV